jgi:hypothetical protein
MYVPPGIYAGGDNQVCDGRFRVVVAGLDLWWRVRAGFAVSRQVRFAMAVLGLSWRV